MGNLWQAQPWHGEHRPLELEWRHGQHVLIAQLFLSLSLNCKVVHFAASLEQPFGRMQRILPFSLFLQLLHLRLNLWF